MVKIKDVDKDSLLDIVNQKKANFLLNWIKFLFLKKLGLECQEVQQAVKISNYEVLLFANAVFYIRKQIVTKKCNNLPEIIGDLLMSIKSYIDRYISKEDIQYINHFDMRKKGDLRLNLWQYMYFSDIESSRDKQLETIVKYVRGSIS